MLIFATLLLLPSSALSACTSCVKPIHSWDNLPVAFHSSEIVTNERGEFTEDELATITRFPLVTIEKWQGSGAVDSKGNDVFLWEETAILNAAKQVKKASPNISVMAWLDSKNVYSGWVFPYNLTHCPHCTVDGPKHELINHTYNADVFAVQGHSRAAEYLESHRELLLHNTSGLPALGWGGLHVYDHTQKQVRNLWRDNCLALTTSGAIDGCGADFSTKGAASGVDPTVATAWNTGHVEAMRITMDALDEGLLVGKNFEQLGDYVSAVLVEGCTASNDTVNSFRSAAACARRSGKRFVAQCHFGHPQYPHPPLNLSIAESTAAAFLCGAGPDHYYVTSGWRATGRKGDHDPNSDRGNFSTHWLPSIMGRPLGAPVSDATYDVAKGVWSRAFASGTKVTFDARVNVGKIQWSDESLLSRTYV